MDEMTKRKFEVLLIFQVKKLLKQQKNLGNPTLFFTDKEPYKLFLTGWWWTRGEAERKMMEPREETRWELCCSDQIWWKINQMLRQREREQISLPCLRDHVSLVSQIFQTDHEGHGRCQWWATSKALLNPDHFWQTPKVPTSKDHLKNKKKLSFLYNPHLWNSVESS